MLYTQAFTLDYDNAPESDIKATFDFGNLLSYLKHFIIEVCTSMPLGKEAYDFLTKPVTK